MEIGKVFRNGDVGEAFKKLNKINPNEKQQPSLYKEAFNYN